MGINNILSNIFKYTQMNKLDQVSQLLELLSDKHDAIIDDGKELNNFEILDIYPEQILDNKKLEQVEIFFDRLTEEDIFRETDRYNEYITIQKKYVQFFKLLWLSSKAVFTFIDIDKKIWRNLNTADEKVLGQSFNQIDLVTNDGENLLLLDTFNLLESIVKFSMSDKIYITIIVPDRKVLFLSNGVNFAVYFLEDLIWMEKIAASEGLFIRS